MTRIQPIERFNNFISPEPNSGCWLWTGFVDLRGYGIFRLARGSMSRAHRVSWTFFRGQIPEKMSVLHRCDVRCCVNPDHLFIGTQDDNMKDAKAKGRLAPINGARNPNAKLNENDVLHVRSSAARSDELASKFSVTLATINLIRRRATWKELPDYLAPEGK